MKLVAGGVPERDAAWPLGAKAAEGPNRASKALGVGPLFVADWPVTCGLMSLAPLVFR